MYAPSTLTWLAGKSPKFNRIYTSSFIVVFPASHSLVNSGFFPPSIPYSWQVVWFSSMDWVRGLCQVADFTNGTGGRIGLSSWVWGGWLFFWFYWEYVGDIRGGLVLLGLVGDFLDDEIFHDVIFDPLKMWDCICLLGTCGENHLKEQIRRTSGDQIFVWWNSRLDHRTS